MDEIIKKYEQDFDPSILNVPYQEGIQTSSGHDHHHHSGGQHSQDIHSHHHSAAPHKARASKNWRLFFKKNTPVLRLSILFFLLYHTYILMALIAPSWDDPLLCWFMQWTFLFFAVSTAGTFLYTGLAKTHVFQRT